ncbi:MAG TPA: M48 family metalloprotease [candidate division Zixibacteria bacterium]|nr:M48 family metalloprotease [candidate division Zixibacteria bacterium]
MSVNTVLLNTRLKHTMSNILFFLWNILHIVIVSTSPIKSKTEGILRFKIEFFQQFNITTFLFALIILFLQIFISYLVMSRKFRRAELALVTELGLDGNNDEKILKNLRIDPKVIHKWVCELAKEQNIRSIKRIYLTDTSIPNAMTLDVLPLPFIRRSWIVLDANVLEILDEREIKAVISHELAHVKRLDGIVNLFRYGTNYFVFISYGLYLIQIVYHIIADDFIGGIDIALKIAYLFVVIFILYLFTIFNQIIMNFSRRQSELMADYYSAKHIGRNHIINALVILGQRMDVISTFGTEFKWLGSLERKENLTREFIQGIKALPSEELSKDISREKAVSIYVKLRLQNMKNDLFIPFTDEEIDELTKIASRKLLKKREASLDNGLLIDKKIKSELTKLIIDWQLVDKDQDSYLKVDEIENLIKIIKDNPNKELFENDLEQRRNILGLDHPSMKERILFLYHAFPEFSSES